MNAIKRNNEVIIEDGYTRAVVYPDGGGYIHVNSEVNHTDLHSPLYLRAAQFVGLDVDDAAITRARAKVQAAFYGEE